MDSIATVLGTMPIDLIFNTVDECPAEQQSELSMFGNTERQKIGRTPATGMHTNSREAGSESQND
jgi:hypothetical protein